MNWTLNIMPSLTLEVLTTDHLTGMLELWSSYKNTDWSA